MIGRVEHVCAICGQVVAPNEARFGPTQNHYACEKPRLDVIAASYDVVQGNKRMGEAIAGLKVAIKAYDAANSPAARGKAAVVAYDKRCVLVLYPNTGLKLAGLADAASRWHNIIGNDRSMCDGITYYHRCAVYADDVSKAVIGERFDSVMYPHGDAFLTQTSREIIAAHVRT